MRQRECNQDYAFISIQKIDGLEISPILSKIAQKNFKTLCIKNTEIFNIDARYFSHFDQYNYFYLYNPFPVSIMKEVISAISTQIFEKKITIIYNNPACNEIIENYGFIKYEEYPDEWGNGIFVYKN